ncbi:MAG: Ig-like domain-containing protein [Lachnospiraceae bacterium]|nr:Ig-like domain-containing protein [Lachnospiraceae bacterium]
MKLAKLKKTLAVLLSAAMVFSAVPVTAMAEEVESEAIEVSGAEETVETEEAATEEVDAEIEESDESQDVEVSGVEEETEAVEELDAVEDNDAVEEDVVGDGEIEEGEYDFADSTKAYYKKSPADINIAGLTLNFTGGQQDSGHGPHGKANDTAVLKLKSAAKVTFTICGYSSINSPYITAEGYTPTIKDTSAILTGDDKNGKVISFDVSKGGDFTAKVDNGQLYLHKINVEYSEETIAAGEYDFADSTKDYYKKNPAEINIPGATFNFTGGQQDSGHGPHGKAGDTVELSLETAATVSFTICGYSSINSPYITAEGYTPSIADTSAILTGDDKNGKVITFNVNKGGKFTAKVDNGQLYLHKINVEYVGGGVAMAGTYDFFDKNSAYYKKAPSEIEIPGVSISFNGTNHTTGHGPHGKEDDTITVNLKEAAKVYFTTCGYSEAAEHYITADGYTATEKNYTVDGDGSNGKTTSFYVEEPGLFTAKVASKQIYLHSIRVKYLTEEKFGDAYIAKTFASVPVVDRTNKDLKAKIYKKDGTLVDTVGSFDENMYMGNSSTSGTVGLQKSVADNLIWVDEDNNTLVITPHTDKDGYPLIEAGESYYVTLDPGLVTVNEADAGITTSTDWTFTATAPEGLLTTNVINVGQDDTSDFQTLSGAFNYLRKNQADDDWTINVAKGVYHERPFYYGDANITIKGDSTKGEFGKDVLFTWKNCDDWTGGGARGRCTFLVQGNGDMNMIGISMVNTFDRKKDFDDGSTQAETLGFDGTGKLFVYDCGFDSHQDTLYIGKKGNRSWFYKSYIAGDVDFLWGYPGVCLFEECSLRCYADTAKETPLAHLIASRTEVKDKANLGANKGFVIMNSTIQMDKGVTVTYARNSGADTNAAIFNNEFTGEGTLNPALYGSAPGYEERDINNDLIVGYMDGDNTYNGTKVDTKERLEHCGALCPRMQNREYSGRYVILNRGYDFTSEKFVTAKNIWDATALATELGIATTADDSAKQIFVEPVGYKNVIGGDSVLYKAYNMSGKEVTDNATWSVTEVDADDPKATGNTTAVDASMDATVKGKLNTKLTTRSKVTVTATLDGKSDDGLCTVIPEYVPADTVQLSLVSGAVDLYGTKTLGGVLSCSTNDQDDVTVTETTWTTSASANALFYDEATKTFVDKVTTKTCSVMVYGAGSGKATITASTKDGGSDTFELTVYDDQTVWLPFVAGVLVNTDVQSGKWGTFNGMFIDTVTYKGKVGMKNSSPTRMQTRNAILNFPVNYDATVKVTLDSAPGTPITAENVGSRVYAGLDTINNTNISWDADTLTYTIDHKAADAKAASVTEPAAKDKAAQGPDAGIAEGELAKAQYLQLSYGSKDVYVTKYVITKPGHQDIEDVADDNVEMAVDSVTLSRETLRIDEGASYKVTATAKYPDGKTTTDVTWSSDDESIATVAADGTITGVKEGVTTITASKDAQSDTVEVTVKKPGRAVITDKAQWITDDMYADKIAAEKMDTRPVDTKDGLITFVPSILATTGKSKSRVDADSAPVKFDDNNEYTRNINMQAGMEDVEGKNSGAYFEFETADAAEVVVFWKSSSGSAGGRKMGIVKVDGDTTTIIDEDEEDFDIDAETGKTVAMALVKKFSLAEGGLYRIGATSGGAKIYAIKVAVGGSVEPGPGPKPEPTPDEPGTVSGDTVDKTGDPVLSEKTVAEVSANYADMAAASAKGAADRTVVVKGAVSDNGVLIQNYKKGKVKSITISTNSVSDCRVTVNAKVKVFLPAGFGGVGAISNMTGVGKTKPLKVNKKGAVSLKAFKGVSKYDVTFTGASGKITITVVNLAFDKALKKLQVSANAILTVRPTLQAGKLNDIKAGAGFLNGVWMVDKTIISKPGQTVSGKNGAKVTLNANGTVTVTNVVNKNVKLTYMLNGKKYTTALKVQKKASGSEGAYQTAGLLK